MYFYQQAIVSNLDYKLDYSPKAADKCFVLWAMLLPFVVDISEWW